MILAERHIIDKNHKEYKKIDNLCFLSKNLYNAALYAIKQHHINTGNHLNYNDLEKQFRLNKQPDYVALPPNTSQQILMQLDKNIRSFFASAAAYKKSKNKFSGIPKPPKYKHKTKGRNLLVFTTNQARLKDGLIRFPKKTELLPIKTKVQNLKQVRIVPSTSCYVIEVLYEKQEIKHENLNKNSYLSIDLGLNNLCAVVSNQPGLQPFLISGKPLKSINQYYNKQKAKIQSELILKQNSFISNKLNKLALKRNNKIKNYMHSVSKKIVNYCINNNIGNIVIGYNKKWKQNIELGKRNNQNFVNIPFLTFINQIQYKATLQGISVTLTEESYTSKCSFLDSEVVQKHEIYAGKRIKRGLFKTAKGVFINADINAAFNILKKFLQETADVVLQPSSIGFVLNPVLLQ